MFDIILIKIAIMSENLSLKIKRNVRKKKLKKFLSKYHLKNAEMKPKIDYRYNTYEGTNLLLIDELIKSHEILQDSFIMDIGSGTGLFLLYLAEKGFNNLYGIEMDNELYNTSLFNINQMSLKNKSVLNSVHIIYGNAIQEEINENITHFYIFNSFFDEDTYLKWLLNIEKSLKKKMRKIKIILLYPTVASIGACRKCGWLKEKRRIICKTQVCYRCVNFLIYENDIG